MDISPSMDGSAPFPLPTASSLPTVPSPPMAEQPPQAWGEGAQLLAQMAIGEGGALPHASSMEELGEQAGLAPAEVQRGLALKHRRMKEDLERRIQEEITQAAAAGHPAPPADAQAAGQ
ncbi:hypothetical protein T492DRAFT_890941 [Pavlovales sp. CCMP2436]|nr:hypothetical protein T492DRAFT_890941 [Pavlovales sp. CCMP2436]